MAKTGWDKDLRPFVLELVAKLGGPKSMKGMRGVNKTWQQGFDLGITHLKIHLQDPILPSKNPLQAALHFTNLATLDIGESRVHESWLQCLAGLPHLLTLRLGSEITFPLKYLPESSLTRRLTDSGLAALSGSPLTRLDLSNCHRLTPKGLQCLRKLPQLAHLNLWNCTRGSWTDAILEDLQGLPVTDIFLEGGSGLTEACLGLLAAMPLTRLSFSNCNWLLAAGLGELRNCPLTSLRLFAGIRLCETSLDKLSWIPLMHLATNCCPWLSYAGKPQLQYYPLMHLSLREFLRRLSGEMGPYGISLCSSIFRVMGMNLGQCCHGKLNDSGLLLLGKMPLVEVNVAGCPKQPSRGWRGVAALQAAWDLKS